ncbi:MAG: tetratricopeptide repeat protein [Calditrichia bacterium]
MSANAPAIIARFSLLCFLTLILSCTSVKFQENVDDYKEEISELNEQLRENPQNAEALRDLGAIYFQTRQYEDARIYLQKAAKQDLNDPKTLFYLGLSMEFDGKEDTALKFYRNYTKTPRTSPYRRLMEGRYHWIKKEMAAAEAKRIVKASLQDSVSAGAIDSDALAVFPMLYRGSEERFAPLGVGLSEMVIIDLGRISSLTLVERIRIQEVLRELDFAKNTYADPATSPRTGRLLGASRVVSGVFNVLRSEQLIVDASSWDLAQRQEPAIINRENELTRLFELEKEIVFDIIKQLGIQPTPAEREQIMLVPTRDMKAFLEYCKGLEREDDRSYNTAVGHYEAALKIDPKFELARQRAERARSLAEAGGSKEDAADTAGNIGNKGGGGKDSPGVGGLEDLIGSRINTIGSTIGSTFNPGEDTRNPGEEILGSGLTELPVPPDPPAND